jgi:hypothetical protein
LASALSSNWASCQNGDPYRELNGSFATGAAVQV